MSTIKLGNLLWRAHTRPISPEDPVDVKDVNTADIKAKLEMAQSELALVKAELQEIKANQLSGDQKVQLSGKIVEDYTDIGQVLRVKQEVLGYRSFDFDGSPTVTVAPGSTVAETEAWHVNGFSTLGYFLRSTDNVAHNFYLYCMMAATPGETFQGSRRVQVPLVNALETPQREGYGTIETFTQWVRCLIMNNDVVEHTYRIHFLLRAG